MNEKTARSKQTMSGKTAVLVGLGVSNRAAARFLRGIGMKVTALDQNTPDGKTLAEMAALGVPVTKVSDFYGVDADIVLRSPGVRPDAISSRGETSSEMEIFVSLCPCPIYAVTGSDGKTTTTTVISKMLEAEFAGSGRKVWLGGNIGTPQLPFIDEIKPDDVCVLELSSFQLMTMNFSPRVAVVTNISPNHLNWHASMDEYIASKRRIFENQSENCRLVVNAENAITAGFESSGETVRFSSQSNADATIKNGAIYVRGKRIVTLSDIVIPGIYNAENYMAAFLATDGVVSAANMAKVAKTFPGVRHRSELVCEKGGIKFINSSIDTSPTRTSAALSALEKKAVIIIGGYDKHIPPEPLIEPLKEKTKVIVCTGDTGERIYNMMKNAGYGGEIYLQKDFEAAVKVAAGKAVSGDVVLLSPAAASFDAFKNFEERGDRFAEIVKNLNI